MKLLQRIRLVSAPLRFLSASPRTVSCSAKSRPDARRPGCGSCNAHGCSPRSRTRASSSRQASALARSWSPRAPPPSAAMSEPCPARSRPLSMACQVFGPCSCNDHLSTTSRTVSAIGYARQSKASTASRPRAYAPSTGRPGGLPFFVRTRGSRQAVARVFRGSQVPQLTSPVSS